MSSDHDLEDERSSARNKIREYKIAKGIISNVLRQLDRQKTSFHDPTMRYLLIVELIRMAIDMGLGIYTEQLLGMKFGRLLKSVERGATEGEDIHIREKDKVLLDQFEETRENTIMSFEKLREGFDDIFGKLQKWIESPTYAPDHKLGRGDMEAAEKDLKQAAKVE